VVLTQAVNDAIPDLYAKAVAEGDVYALGQPPSRSPTWTTARS